MCMSKLSHSQYAQLVKQAQAGSSAAFASLYAATVESQLYFATAFLKDATLAEDAVQEVYISLYNNLPNIKDGQTFVAYLRRICYNSCVDFKRKQQRQLYELNDTVLANHKDMSVENSPDERYAALERTSDIYGVLETLPDDHRAAFLLRYYESMKISDIATALNLSISSIKRYIRTTTDVLREKLS